MGEIGKYSCHGGEAECKVGVCEFEIMVPSLFVRTCQSDNKN